jgi:hypothetical protein
MVQLIGKNKTKKKGKTIMNKILDLIKIFLFKISSKNRQIRLIERNAILFLGLQNLAMKNERETGDTVESMMISSESYKYLGNFAIYCDTAGVNQLETLKKYKN